MKDILEKISTYNIFNFIVPGALFAYIIKEITSFDFVKADIIQSIVIFYFLGLIISRVGSLVIEPILKKIKILKFTEYKEYVIASKKDTKIELLSEVNNTYRTFVSMSIILIVAKAYDNYLNIYTKKEPLIYIFLGLLIVIFMISYAKQTNYITKRVKANLENKE
jgi:hypothetical protein